MPTDLSQLRFRAETSPLELALELSWELPDPAQPPENTPIIIIRRERRFPGKSRRGVVPTVAGSDDLTDGVRVYDSGTFNFDFEESRDEREGDRLVSTARQYLYVGNPRDRILTRSLRREFDAGGAPLRTTIRFIDQSGLTANRIYYYTAFVDSDHRFSRLTQASALVTGQYNHALFSALPQIHHRFDTILPPPFSVARVDQTKGQLQRFLEVFEAHADMLHGFIDGLRDLHHPRRVDSRLLPQLANFIGWTLKDFLDEDGQRNEIIFAPEVYKTVGTSPNIAAMVNRLTGWDTRVREFCRHVVLSFDQSRLERLETTTVYLDGSLAPTPTPPPFLQGRRIPPGSINTADPTAMFKLRTRAFDDQTAYSYDCGRSDGRGGYLRDNNIWYNRETIGIYIVPDVETEFFSIDDEWNRINQVIAEFLPIPVRAIFVLQPSVVVEEAYDATRMVTEELLVDSGLLLENEAYGEGLEEGIDRIPGWRWFVANSLAHRAVNTAIMPIDTSSRTWHTGLA